MQYIKLSIFMRLRESGCRLLHTAASACVCFKAIHIVGGLHKAAMLGNIGRVHALMKEGAKIEARDDQGRTAFMLAAMHGHKAVMRMLMPYANMNARDIDQRTVLMLAAIKGRTQIVRILMTEGVSVIARDKNGRTALILATFHKQLNAVKALLESRKWHVDIRDHRNYTALKVATEQGSVEIAQTLRARYANPKCCLLETGRALWKKKSLFIYANI